MLYNDYRPKNFSEIKGQEVAVKILTNQIIRKENSNAYLFVGVHGTGKTSIAKIFSRALNCENPTEFGPCNECDSCKEHFEGKNMDIIEIDGASNNGVEDVRKIKNEITYRPLRNKKVYVIDEVHMLSTAAFNALLTTLEEPPANVVFILCTTELQKVPKTILSRCLRLDFERIDINEVVNRMEYICGDLGIIYSMNAITKIATISNGSMRDALSLLEKCLQYGDLSEKNVSDVLGIVDSKTTISIVKNILKKDLYAAISEIEKLHKSGKDLVQLTNDIIEVFRNLMILQTTQNEKLFNMDVSQLKGVEIDIKDCFEAINTITKLVNNIKLSDNPKVVMDIMIMQVINLLPNINVPDDIIEETEEENFFNKEPLRDNEKSKEEVEDNSKEKREYIKQENIDHTEMLIYKIELLKRLGIDDPRTKILINSKIYAKKNAIYIKTNEDLDLVEIEELLREISGKKINLLSA